MLAPCIHGACSVHEPLWPVVRKVGASPPIRPRYHTKRGFPDCGIAVAKYNGNRVGIPLNTNHKSQTPRSMKKTERQFRFGKVGGLFLAASIIAPGTSLFAEDVKKPAIDREKPEQHQQLQSNQEDVKEFKGTIVSAYAYLMQEQAKDTKSALERRDTSGADATGTRNHNPSRSDLAVANSAEATTDRNRSRANNATARTGEDNNRATDRSWMREPAGSPGMSDGPMGLLVQTDGVLELGTGTKFYLLVPQEGETVNQTSYSQLNRSTRPNANANANTDRDQGDRTYVREQLQDEPGSQKGGEKQTELSGDRAFDAKSSESKSGHEVTVMGKVVQRGGLEAIIVHDMSWKSEGSAGSEIERTPARTGDRYRNPGNTTDRERNDSNNRTE